MSQHPRVLQHFLFTFTRLIQDHLRSPQLQQKELLIVDEILRQNVYFLNKFMLGLSLGRDFFRLLQMISSFPEIKKLFETMQNSPSTLDPKFRGMFQFTAALTPREFITSRLTPDMEFKMVFMLHHVPKHLHYTYLERFRQRFLVHGSESLVPDLIRFVCTVIHPGNAILRSGIVQRWELIGSLFAFLTNPVYQQHSKAALFYDWFYFNLNADNIMNIEPGILLLYKSVLTESSSTLKPYLCTNLLEFIQLFCKNYSPLQEKETLWHVRVSMYAILDKKVISSLKTLHDAEALPNEGKDLLQALFSMFMNADGGLPGLESLSTEDVVHIPDDEQVETGTTVILSLNENLDSENLVSVLKIYLTSIEDDELERIDVMLLKFTQDSENAQEKFMLVIRTMLEIDSSCNVVHLMQHFISLIQTCDILGDPMFVVFKAFATKMIQGDITTLFDGIVLDMSRMMLDDDPIEFYQALPFLYAQLQKQLTGNREFIDLVLSLIDPLTVSILELSIKNKEFVIFGEGLVEYLGTVDQLSGFSLIVVHKLVLAELYALPQATQSKHIFTMMSYIYRDRSLEKYSCLYPWIFSLPLHIELLQAVLTAPQKHHPIAIDIFKYFSSYSDLKQKVIALIKYFEDADNVAEIGENTLEESIFQRQQKSVFNRRRIEQCLLALEGKL